MVKRVVFVGWVNWDGVPADGESAKNQYLVRRLQQYCDVTILDFYNKKKHPWIYLQALWAFVSQPDSTIVLSTSAKNIYPILKVLKFFGIKRDIIYWVIGGVFGQRLINGEMDPEIFAGLRLNLVESKEMVKELQSVGLTNVLPLSNFKTIKYIPNDAINKRLEDLADSNNKVRLVFLSRIMPEKGCDYILGAVKELNNSGLSEKYIVDFYGKIEPSYKDTFESKIANYGNVNYCGVLDLRSNSGYDRLASYHAMLFPTYWRGEGMAGVFIDAFIAGLPMLASDWAHNAEFIADGESGVLYPVHDVNALMEVMRKCINREYDLIAMAEVCREEAMKYDTDAVLNESCLKRIGLIDG